MNPDHEYYSPKGGTPNHTSLVDLDRDRGILTPADRRALVGKASFDPESNSARKARQRIRDRVRDSLRDFYLLLNHLEDRDLNQVFGQDEPERTLHDDVISVLPSVLGFIYAGSTTHPDDGPGIFEQRVRAGINAAEVVRNDRTVDVEVKIRVKPEDSLDEIAKQVHEKGVEASVTADQMNALLAAGKVERELYAKVMENLLQ